MRNFHTSSRLEDDINACCDEISHAWLLANIAMDETILQRWLKAGDVAEKQCLRLRREHLPGGVLFPVPANRTLDGLEQVFARRLASTKTLQRRSHIVERGGSDDITSAIVRAQKSSAASSDEALGLT